MRNDWRGSGGVSVERQAQQRPALLPFLTSKNRLIPSQERIQNKMTSPSQAQNCQIKTQQDALEVLQEARENSHLSLSEAAEKLEVSPSTLSRWLSGKKAPSLARWLELLEAFGLVLEVSQAGVARPQEDAAQTKEGVALWDNSPTPQASPQPAPTSQAKKGVALWGKEKQKQQDTKRPSQREEPASPPPQPAPTPPPSPPSGPSVVSFPQLPRQGLFDPAFFFHNREFLLRQIAVYVREGHPESCALAEFRRQYPALTREHIAHAVKTYCGPW